MDTFGMSKFSDWLDQKHGRAQELVRFLDTHKNQVSRVKRGVTKMPSRWLKPIVTFSKGELAYEDLLDGFEGT